MFTIFCSCVAKHQTLKGVRKTIYDLSAFSTVTKITNWVSFFHNDTEGNSLSFVVQKE